MKFGKKEKILYSAAMVLQILAFFVYPVIVKNFGPFLAFSNLRIVILYPLILTAIISGVVGFVSSFKLKGLYPLVVTLMFVVSIVAIFGPGQITDALDLAAFCAPHIVLDYFGFFVGVIGRWYGLNKRKNAEL